jgi:hypothetical protein
MTTSSTRRPFQMAETARIRGGTLITQHGPNCASHEGGECACNPTYRLQRVRKARGR